MEEFLVYSEYIKPFWAPPSWLFGSVWTILYAIIAVSFGVVIYKVAKKQIPRMVALPFILNLIFNFAFTPIQFGLKNNLLASLDVVLVFVTLIWALIVIWPRMRWVVFANIPYVLWVMFATVLQITITYLNR
ncbi:MAG: TspO protein [Candidatus Taylorbacteria bacterium RIFCSPLOWO2_02_FULL_43_11]|uniref:TspO protein n=1 Tax=Candidatus Taylorbacteria bacterium RIFCSPHIGHO2_02_FULL_43_32b TaxID=1802306 RepID=A0A1G2MJW4_9BACT|nr:MAG: TspO protein [Candidatus Taylorbacteria bacterium RIFCSPHIGHO2_01_FULL_43_47]OHA24220.1 MAG: TspO protein [Candidatus Taylorbacteria bacterium RIFCSPHIGHO2_02_FULL_43_32b]OHA31262.1 MAG: TspO protein [Candidatus Taylorbacteria bacterium RIFCSPLOWO2_01_FULL_43_44]OHA37831.1 MAG: TspO protein [Candidatus Taylorbacteria bacterium RIFCSPLOWO2_02_FULL_43_11]